MLGRKDYMLFWSTTEHIMKENQLIHEIKWKKARKKSDSNMKLYSD